MRTLMKIKALLLPVFLSLALSGCIVTSAVNLAATTVMTAGKIAVKGTGALINAAIPGKDKKKDKEKKSREQQADDYLEEPREE